MALYVYGIMRSAEAECAVAATNRDASVRVEAVQQDRVSALVSTMPGSELRLRRDSILGHSDVLQSAFEHGPVLPFRFGTAVADADAVKRELLAPTADALAARLDALDGKAEMQLKAVYSEEPLLRSILADKPELARSAQRTQSMPAAATHFERIRLGEAIAAGVQSRQAADGEALMRVLAPLARAHILSPPHHERAALNAAFLVERLEVAQFDQAVEALSEQRTEIEFKLIGPMPPYSFADRDWVFATSRQGAAWA